MYLVHQTQALRPLEEEVFFTGLCYYQTMRVAEIEGLPEVREAARVLHSLEGVGLVEPAIASGWTRAMLTETSSSDIDVACVGPVHYEKAQQHLRAVLEELGVDPNPWDINGIWNAQMSYGVERTVDNYLLYYVDSIDSVYLASDGKLHDPTGFGFQDAKARLLRLNEYDRLDGRTPTPSEEVNVCLEGCRRIAQLKWDATQKSLERITEGVKFWEMLTNDETAYFIRKLGNKFDTDRRPEAKEVYSRYGWGFIFEHLGV